MMFDDLIEAATRSLEDEPALRALFIGGSFGRGSADAFSDLDLVGLAAPETHAALAARWRQILEAWAPIVYWEQAGWGGTLINAIAADWRRVDLYLLPPDRLGTRAQSGLRVLIDRDGAWDALPETLPEATPDVARLRQTVREFIRVMGLLPVGVGRAEWVTLVMGVGLLRDKMASVMMETCREADRGGILHMRRLLPPEDIAVLEALPYPGPDKDALIEAHRSLAAAFFPRARALAHVLGMDWPEEFEAAMRVRLRDALGIELPGTVAG